MNNTNSNIMNPTIICPRCQAEIALTDAIAAPLREEMAAEFERKRKAQEEALARNIEALKEQQKALEQARADFDAELARKLAAEKAVLEQRLMNKARADLAGELNDLKASLAEREKKLAEAEKAELDLRHKQRDLELRQKSLELEIARKLDAERTRIQEEATRHAVEEQHLRLSEKEKLITDLQKQIDTLKQKAEQGSQQLQGEVLELELEELLKSRFPHDDIQSVAKGVRGADVLQTVRLSNGQACGAIVWEAKRTRNWAPAWIGKLKEDQRSLQAEAAILLTQAMPSGCAHFAQQDGVWITDYACAMGLASALRQGLIGIAMSHSAETNKNEKMEVLYSYLTSTAFRQQVETIVESFATLKQDLDAEKRAMQKIWAKREKQLDHVLLGTSQLYGGLQGIVGQNALPEIERLQLPEND